MTAGRKINSQNQAWCTPPQYVEAVKRVFRGKIDLDPCSSVHSIVEAKVEYLLPEIDGLSASWDYPTIFVNPPYGFDRERGTSIKDWLSCCLEAYKKHSSEVIALIPVAVNTRHWKKSVFGGATGVCFLYDTRLKFLEGGQLSSKGAPMACSTIYWGDRYQDFFDVFISYGAVVDIRPLINITIGEKDNI